MTASEQPQPPQLAHTVRVTDSFGHSMAAMCASSVIVATFNSATPFDRVMTYALAPVLILGAYLFAGLTARRAGRANEMMISLALREDKDMPEGATRRDAEIAIAKVIHAYDHPDYDTCTYCVFCLAIAENVLNDLPPKDGPPSGGWIQQEAARARARIEALPRHARPVVTSHLS